MDLLTIIGTRPQIIKAATVHKVIAMRYDGYLNEHLLYTGQHYDANMSEIFFKQLQMPAPTYRLDIRETLQGQQTAAMLSGIEKVMQSRHFDAVLVYGDTNSTLAGALAAAKMQIPLFHVEAGLRSFCMTMPEEVNRIVTDHLSQVCYAPTETAYRQLLREGLGSGDAVFPNGKHREIVCSGDVMYDSCLHHAAQTDRVQSCLDSYGLRQGAYVLATVHRAANTDAPQRLAGICTALSSITRQYGLPVVLPLHPRTRKAIEAMSGLDIATLHVVPPVGYLDMLALESNAQVVLTDSGGVQKESYFLQRPCVILRDETEWTEIVQAGAAAIAGSEPDTILSVYNRMRSVVVAPPTAYGDGHAATYIVDHMVQCLSC